jgi:hypothetical protein
VFLEGSVKNILTLVVLDGILKYLLLNTFFVCSKNQVGLGGAGAWTGLIWLRTGTGGGLL